jgi:hypothetical protein
MLMVSSAIRSLPQMSAAANFGGIDRGVNDRNPEGSEGVGGLSLSGPHG